MLKPENNFVFFGGNILGFRCLKLLINANLHPSLVVVNPDDKGEHSDHLPSVLKLSNENGLSVIGLKQLLSKDGINKLKTISPSVGFCAFFSRLIPKSVIQNFDLGITNLHFSLLPELRGQYPTVYAIFEGRKETGVTLHWINEEVDLGDIILQEKVKILHTETGYSLFNKCLDIAENLFKKQIIYFQKNSWPEKRSQDLAKAALSPIRKQLPNDGKIDWNWNGKQIRNFIRAMSYPPHTIAKFSIGEKKFEIHQLEDLKEN